MTLALLLATGLGPRIATAQQATPTASRPMDLSLFGAVSGVNTGLSGGRNASLTIGGDLGFAPFLGLQPALEVRATLPLDKGVIDSQKDLLGGLRVNFLLAHRIHPYGDFLYGRGQVNYPGAGYLYNDFYYFQSVGNVLSPGAGFDYSFSAGDPHQPPQELSIRPSEPSAWSIASAVELCRSSFLFVIP